MKKNVVFFILSLFLCVACLDFSQKEEPIGVTAADDQLIGTYNKEINDFEKEKKVLVDENTLIKKNVNCLTVDPNYLKALKKQIHINQRYIDQIQQQVDYLKVRTHIREKYIADNGANLKKSDLASDLEAYEKNKESNKEIYAWRKNPVQINTTLLEEKCGPKKEPEKE